MATIKRRSTAVWNGSGAEGTGHLTSTSGVLSNTPYSFATRFKSEDGKAGTNPEELIAAAHAGCFSMALSFQLGGAGFTPTELKTEATVQLESADPGFRIASIHLTVSGKVPNISESQFKEIAESAKANCPVSQALKAIPIDMDATLEH